MGERKKRKTDGRSKLAIHVYLERNRMTQPPQTSTIERKKDASRHHHHPYLCLTKLFREPVSGNEDPMKRC